MMRGALRLILEENQTVVHMERVARELGGTVNLGTVNVGSYCTWQGRAARVCLQLSLPVLEAKIGNNGRL